MKKVPKNIDKDMQRYLGALNEMHGENLKGIREGFVILNKKLDNQAKVLDSHTEMIGTLMEDVSELKSDVSVLKSDVSELKSDMVMVKEDLSVVKRDLKKKVDNDNFLSLVKRAVN